LHYFCSPQRADSALFPIISQVECAARSAHDDTAEAKLDKLDVLLAQSFTPRQDAALIAEMLPGAERWSLCHSRTGPAATAKENAESAHGTIAGVSSLRSIDG
jgi:hypothetical protein